MTQSLDKWSSDPLSHFFFISIFLTSFFCNVLRATVKWAAFFLLRAGRKLYANINHSWLFCNIFFLTCYAALRQRLHSSIFDLMICFLCSFFFIRLTPLVLPSFFLTNLPKRLRWHKMCPLKKKSACKGPHFGCVYVFFFFFLILFRFFGNFSISFPMRVGVCFYKFRYDDERWKSCA